MTLLGSGLGGVAAGGEPSAQVRIGGTAAESSGERWLSSTGLRIKSSGRNVGSGLGIAASVSGGGWSIGGVRGGWSESSSVEITGTLTQALSVDRVGVSSIIGSNSPVTGSLSATILGVLSRGEVLTSTGRAGRTSAQAGMWGVSIEREDQDGIN